MTEPSHPEPYRLVVAGPVGRAIRERLPERVAWAAIEFINGPLIANPHRVGGELQRELAGIHSAHLETFRVQYRIDDENRTVRVIRVERRGSIYGIS